MGHPASKFILGFVVRATRPKAPKQWSLQISLGNKTIHQQEQLLSWKIAQMLPFRYLRMSKTCIVD